MAKLIQPRNFKVKQPLYDNHYVIQRPCLGMTFTRLNEPYGIADFCKCRQKNLGVIDLYKEFDRFRKEIQNCCSMQELLQQYSSHNGKIRDCEYLKEEKRRLKSITHETLTDHIVHIHIKRGGNGSFVLWGLVYDNIFEILSIDPLHETI